MHFESWYHMGQKTQSTIELDILKSNRIGLCIILFCAIIFDGGLYIWAKIDSTYPANHTLLDYMLFVVAIDALLFIGTFILYNKKRQWMTLFIPLLLLISKLSTTFFMTFDFLILFYYFIVLLVIIITIRTKWEMLVIGCFSQMLIVYQWSLGLMSNVESPIIIIILHGGVVLLSGFVSLFRYNHYIQLMEYQEKLLEKKCQIVQLMQIKDLSLELNHMLIEHMSLEEYLSYIVERIYNIVDPADAIAILLIENDQMRMISNKNYCVSDCGDFILDIKYSFSYNLGIFENKEPMIINDIPSHIVDKSVPVLPCLDGRSILSSLSTPLIVEGKLYGFFNIDSARDNVFTETDIELMKYFGEQVSIVLEHHALYAKIKNLSEYDQLTGFRNRWYINEIENNHFCSWKQQVKPVAIVVFDLDGLKIINDNYGHDMGDLYIKTFSQELLQAFDSENIFIRSGGDEFVGVFFNFEKEQLETQLEYLKTRLYISVDNEKNYRLPVHFSYGISIADNLAEDLQSAMKEADEKMYAYKAINRKPS